jgi:predicted CxxxxCH...CXXCH cytochrome family protein
MRCESAARAVTSEDLLPPACQSPSAMRCHTDTSSTGLAVAVSPTWSPIQVLTAVDVATPGKAVV